MNTKQMNECRAAFEAEVNNQHITARSSYPDEDYYATPLGNFGFKMFQAAWSRAPLATVDEAVQVDKNTACTHPFRTGDIGTLTSGGGICSTCNKNLAAPSPANEGSEDEFADFNAWFGETDERHTHPNIAAVQYWAQEAWKEGYTKGYTKATVEHNQREACIPEPQPSVRDQALEEAASIADEMILYSGQDIANSIRAIKSVGTGTEGPGHADQT